MVEQVRHVSGTAWEFDRNRVRRALETRLAGAQSCTEALESFEGLIGLVTEFMARLLGDGGSRAVLSRAISLAAEESPLAHKISARRGGPDLSELRIHVETYDCSVPELVEPFTNLVEMVFLTLSDLTGDLLTTPLLEQLERSKRGPSS